MKPTLLFWAALSVTSALAGLVGKAGSTNVPTLSERQQSFDNRSKDAMVIIDRSGSMSLTDANGQEKLKSAQYAAAMFLSLIRTDVSNRVGLVSYNSGAVLDYNLTDMDPGVELDLIGPTPHTTGGIINGMVSGGMTAIGKALDMAQQQIPDASVLGRNPPHILLLTDGLSNTSPPIEDILPSLKAKAITVHAIGFGQEDEIDVDILEHVTSETGGIFTLLTEGYDLLKYFLFSFGDIFEFGTLADPDFEIPSDRSRGEPFRFQVCGEQFITVATGWNDETVPLTIDLITPSGKTIRHPGPITEGSHGPTWSWVRTPYPEAGEWQAIVRRDPQLSNKRQVHNQQTPSYGPPVRYFVSVIPTGGPEMGLTLKDPTLRFYTGDPLNPQIDFGFDYRTAINTADVSLTLSRPTYSLGTLLSRYGIGPGAGGPEPIPPFQATLGTLNLPTKKDNQKFTLPNTPQPSLARRSFSRNLVDELIVEGDYRLHFKSVSQGATCVHTRERVAMVHVGVGVDPSSTLITTDFTALASDGKSGIGSLTFTPKDRYSNFLGPGRLLKFNIVGTPGTDVTATTRDNNDGSYTVSITWDPTGDCPGIILAQPGRSPITIWQQDNCVLPDDLIPDTGKCETCSPHPGENLCHVTTGCSDTPFGTMCACRPGYKADFAGDETEMHWRMEWPVEGHEHRVYVKPGVGCDTLCDEWYLGVNGCQEVGAKDC